jgi:hypothetical protein
MQRRISAFLALCSVAYATTTTLYVYDLSDASANTLYPQGDKEYHCFDIEGGNKVYVRGTYGYFGYFEGAVDENDPQLFYVNWFETAAGTLLPTSGSATLTYSALFDEVSGPFWSSGTSDFKDSFGSWLSTDGSVFADDSTLAGRTSMLARCLYPGAATVLARADIAALNNTIAVTGESLQGQNTLCYMPAGPAGGSWLGTYRYVFDDDDGEGDELGTYGTDPYAFWGQSGMGFVGTYYALTGTFAGLHGSNIYMVVADTSKTYLVGFYCDVNDDKIKIKCAPEYYEVTTVNGNTDRCPHHYRLQGTLDPLYEFASTGSSNSETKSSAVPIALAIFFGCLSGLLIIVVIIILYIKAQVQQQKVVAAATYIA